MSALLTRHCARFFLACSLRVLWLLSFRLQNVFKPYKSSVLLVMGSSQLQLMRMFPITLFSGRVSVMSNTRFTKAGHAPSILGYERLPGGWFAVAIEYIEPGTAITKSDLLTSNRDRWVKELEHLVSDFHAKNLVHGALRDANIICKGDSLMLIDFDWGGRVGEASYPTLELNPELLEDRTSDDLRITKDGDVRVLTKTLGKLLRSNSTIE
ncbi:hypothetical protein EDB84DRAFT_1460146 [Lactarius hengduanensis]|nr:hypothetical protein EDB84DRAFT_1460146 [Lactarius hengduanensis]